MAAAKEALWEALSKVIDPEIHRPITDLGMVGPLECDADGKVSVEILLTTAACPLGSQIATGAEKALLEVEGVNSVEVKLGAMTPQQREELAAKLRGGPVAVNPFNQPGNLTKIYAITSGKGGVGKSSITANLAAAMSAAGLKVGVVDADIYGFSLPRMLGVNREVQKVDNMLIPPVAHGVKVMSIGMFVPAGAPVIWRGPMLHRAVSQFITDVYWGDLDALLLDLPPGTGDVALSVAQLLPQAEIILVTTPQVAAAEVAQRAGALAAQTKQKVAGVIENMSYMVTESGNKLPIFGTGGGSSVARDLSAALGYEVPLLGQIPLEIELREGGDAGAPLSISTADTPGARTLRQIATTLIKSGRNLSGKQLGLSPQSHS